MVNGKISLKWRVTSGNCINILMFSIIASLKFMLLRIYFFWHINSLRGNKFYGLEPMHL